MQCKKGNVVLTVVVALVMAVVIGVALWTVLVNRQKVVRQPATPTKQAQPVVQDSKQEKERRLAECESSENPVPRSSCYSNVALEFADDPLCEKIKNDDEKGNCYYEIVMKTKEFSKCDSIANQRARYMCYRDSAPILGDDSICEKIIEPKDVQKSIKSDCLFGVYYEKNKQDIDK